MNVHNSDEGEWVSLSRKIFLKLYLVIHFWIIQITKGNEVKALYQNFPLCESYSYSPSLFRIFSWENTQLFILGIQHWLEMMGSMRKCYHLKKIYLKWKQTGLWKQIVCTQKFQEVLHIWKHMQNHFSLMQWDLYVFVITVSEVILFSLIRK